RGSQRAVVGEDRGGVGHRASHFVGLWIIPVQGAKAYDCLEVHAARLIAALSSYLLTNPKHP
ncbi:MAG TPA: hypothetical protein P5537_16045, partial [Thauera sp.]|uniref:hypothetical protein n=1 Tax=Thauera sp. TaxID=1905334 RepID=UPI002BED68F5